MIEETVIHHKILGHDWEISFVDKDSNKINSKLSGTSCFGICNSVAKYIFIADNVKETIVKDTLIHELVHAYLGATLHHTEDEPEFEEEFVCEFLVNFGQPILDDCAAILRKRAAQKKERE